MIKVCIWMNIPSHYQTAFFEALHDRNEIDLWVCYFETVSASRAAEGWSDAYTLKEYEACCDGTETSAEMLAHVPDWKQRVHIISSYFNAELVEFFCRNHVQWCHWSEMPGVRLAELLSYRMRWFRLLRPLMLALKWREGTRIRKYAIGALGQGRLARKAFQRMGVPYEQTADLFYTPAALSAAEPCSAVREFANGRHVFLSVGALCERKGIDVLLKAFRKVNADDWCVVLCGLDRENGRYQSLASKLGISHKIMFLGAWPSDQIAEVYAASEVFVLASRFDGWGAVLNEAASTGLPIIGTDLCGGSWHVIRPAKNGFRVRAGSVASLAGAMQKYVRNPDLLKAHGQASSDIFAEDFTPEMNADRLINALRKWGAHAS